MTYFPRTSEQGYSLVETIVYVALFVGLSALLIDSLIVMGKAYTESRASRDILVSAQTSVDRIMRDVRSANDVNVFLSYLEESPGILLLDETAPNGAASTERFSLENGQVMLSVDGASEVPLTDPHVVVDSLVFRHIGTGASEAVRVEMTLHSLRSLVGRSATIADTALIRKGE